MQHDRFGRHAPRVRHRQRVHRADEMRVLDAFRQARGARRVHERQQVSRPDLRHGRRVARLSVQESKSAIARCFVVGRGVDQHPRGLRRDIAPHVVEDRQLVRRCDHDRRRRVGEQRCKSARGQHRRQRHRDSAELRACPICRKQLERVREHGGHPGTMCDAECSERVRPAIHISIEFAPVETNIVPMPGPRFHDDGRVTWSISRMARGQ